MIVHNQIDFLIHRGNQATQKTDENIGGEALCRARRVGWLKERAERAALLYSSQLSPTHAIGGKICDLIQWLSLNSLSASCETYEIRTVRDRYRPDVVRVP